MKICPKCEAVFDDSLNYCLEHGTELVDAATYKPELLSSSKLSADTVELQAGGSAVQRQQETNPFSRSDFGPYNKKKTSVWPILLILGAAVLLIGGAAVGGALYLKHYIAEHPIKTSPPPRTPTVIPSPTPEPVEKLHVEADTTTTSGKFGEKFIRCLVTNVSGSAVEDAGASLTFYDKDVKVDSRTEKLKLRYLRAGETYPVWIDAAGVKKYDRVVAEQGPFVHTRATSPYLDLAVTETAMTTETKTSSYNFQLYQEPFYTVTGIIQNTTSNTLHPSVDVVYYDAKSEIIGYANTSVGELKPGDKAKVEAEAGATQLHGKPTRFDLIVSAGY